MSIDTNGSPSTDDVTVAPDASTVDDLHLAYKVRGVPNAPCSAASRFSVRPGEAYGLVGESGCGKSTTAYAAMRYMPENAVIEGGRVLADGQDVTAHDERRAPRLPLHHGVDGVPGPRAGR